MDQLIHDLRSAVRSALRTPGSTTLVVLTLAVAIGANTLAFSVVHGILVQPLPYPQPDRLVRIFETAPGQPDELRSVAHPTLGEWRGSVGAFEGLALFGPWSVDLAADGHPEQLSGAAVSGEFFRVFGVPPARGREFLPEELRPHGARAIVLADSLWRRRFGGDLAILGRALDLSGETFLVVGVMPPGFAYPARAEFWVTTGIDPEYDSRGARHLSAVARLRPGTTVEEATAELTAREHALGERLPDNYAGFGVKLYPLRDWIVGDSRPALRALFAAVAAVLAIACANIANLMLHRSLRRGREMAVRAALGAGRGRLARQLFAESLSLALLGGGLGVLLANLGLRLFRVAAADRFPRIGEVVLDGRVLLFTLAVAVTTGLLVGLLPALHAQSPRLQGSLSSGARTHSADPSRGRLRRALVVAQTAVAVGLLVVAGLLVRTLLRLAATESGLDPEGLLTFHVGLPPARQEDESYVVSFYRELHERLAAVPGVAAVGFASRLPLSGEDHSSWFRLPGDPPDAARRRSAQDRAVSAGYFAALRVPVRGREFERTDGPTAPPVAMVNETFARRYFAGRDPIGQWLHTGRDAAPHQIVGVAGDTRQFGLDTPAEPEFYLPQDQDPWPWLSVVVRTGGEPRSLLPLLERAVWSLARDMPLTDVRTMDQMQAAALASRRWNALVLAAFALVALALAAVGTYSVMSHLVGERRREMGIRLALGASPAGLLSSTLSQGLRLAIAGTVVGSLAAVGAAGALRKLLFGVGALDPLTFGAVALLVAGAILLASLLPARRAATIDPIQALRE